MLDLSTSRTSPALRIAAIGVARGDARSTSALTSRWTARRRCSTKRAQEIFPRLGRSLRRAALTAITAPPCVAQAPRGRPPTSNDGRPRAIYRGQERWDGSSTSDAARRPLEDRREIGTVQVAELWRNERCRSRTRRPSPAEDHSRSRTRTTKAFPLQLEAPARPGDTGPLIELCSVASTPRAKVSVERTSSAASQKCRELDGRTRPRHHQRARPRLPRQNDPPRRMARRNHGPFGRVIRPRTTVETQETNHSRESALISPGGAGDDLVPSTRPTTRRSNNAHDPNNVRRARQIDQLYRKKNGNWQRSHALAQCADIAVSDV